MKTEEMSSCFRLILNAMQVLLNEVEREQLCHEFLAYFGLVGAKDECAALEATWLEL